MKKLLTQAQQHLSRTAIIDPNGRYSYQDLLDTSTKVATYLLQEKPDLEEARIAFWVPPGFDYVAVQWGIWRAGGIAVPLCAQHPLPSLVYVLENAEVSQLIVSGEAPTDLRVAARERGIQVVEVDAITSAASERKLPNIEPSRRAMILYTSGTTSLPKGVVSTHANLEAQIQALTNAWAWEPSDHILNILPLHHVHGIVNVLCCALWSGAICEFLPKFEAAKVWGKFGEGKLSLFMAVPTIYFKLMAYWELQSEAEQQRLSASAQGFRLMVSGSAALPVSVLEKWRNITGQTLLERYGMTEIGMALSNSYTGERRPGHVGLPLPGVHIRLVDEAGNEVSEGTAGEIQIQGPSVFLEYWKKPEATTHAFQGDWFKTGDIAVYENGSFRILGRNSVDIIKSGGYKISALEIEGVLLRHPEIDACAVVGIPDEEWGETVAVALVLKNDTLTIEELKTWAAEQLPRYKIPRKMVILDTLPRNTLGKVTKNALKDLELWTS